MNQPNQTQRLPEAAASAANNILEGFSNDALIEALRSRGLLISAWSPDDLEPMVENDQNLGEVDDDLLLAAQVKVFDNCYKVLGDAMTKRGNEVLEEHWERSGAEALAEATSDLAAACRPK